MCVAAILWIYGLWQAGAGTVWFRHVPCLSQTSSSSITPDMDGTWHTCTGSISKFLPGHVV